jgi:hypothetical protein
MSKSTLLKDLKVTKQPEQQQHQQQHQQHQHQQQHQQQQQIQQQQQPQQKQQSEEDVVVQEVLSEIENDRTAIHQPPSQHHPFINDTYANQLLQQQLLQQQLLQQQLLQTRQANSSEELNDKAPKCSFIMNLLKKIIAIFMKDNLFFLLVVSYLIFEYINILKVLKIDNFEVFNNYPILTKVVQAVIYSLTVTIINPFM